MQRRGSRCEKERGYAIIKKGEDENLQNGQQGKKERPPQKMRG